MCLNDGSLSRHTDVAHSGGPGGAWQSGTANDAPPAPYRDQSAYSDAGPSYGGPVNTFEHSEQQQHQQHGGYDHQSAPQQHGWANNAGAGGHQYAPSRPAPYQDTPSGSSYGGNPSGGYNNGPPGGGVPQYGGPTGGGYGQNLGGGGGYGQSSAGAYGQASGDHGGGGYGYTNPGAPGGQPLASGLNAWSATPSTGAPAKASSSGMWSSSGYQKKDPTSAVDLPRYHASSLARDNRPTVLVGHSLNFPKPMGSGVSGGGYNGPSGGYNNSGGAYGGNPSSSFGGSGAYAGSGGGGGYGGPSGGYGGSANTVGGGGGFGSSQSIGAPGFMDNTSRFSSNRGMGMTNTQPLNVNQAPTTKLGKTVEGLKKIGNEARERWDRRNMDKSMASSLADHDELRAGHVMDRGYQYQPNAQHGTGGGDTSRDYERGMIDNLCASVGLARAPPADGLKRFVDLAQTLDVQTIGDILLDKLEDESWQVRLKGLHVVVALLESPNGAPYMDWFEDNVDVLEEVRRRLDLK